MGYPDTSNYCGTACYHLTA